jgi:hypothetical protein
MLLKTRRSEATWAKRTAVGGEGWEFSVTLGALLGH